jgi:hypothetical protein
MTQVQEEDPMRDREQERNQPGQGSQRQGEGKEGGQEGIGNRPIEGQPGQPGQHDKGQGSEQGQGGEQGQRGNQSGQQGRNR